VSQGFISSDWDLSRLHASSAMLQHLESKVLYGSRTIDDGARGVIRLRLDVMLTSYHWAAGRDNNNCASDCCLKFDVGV